MSEISDEPPQEWPYRDLEGLDPASLVQANMGADFLAALKQQVIGDSSEAEAGRQ